MLDDRDEINRYVDPSMENVVAEYYNLRRQVDLLKKTKGADPGAAVSDMEIIASCDATLERVRKLLEGWPAKVHLIWRLLHSVSRDLILVMDEAELAAKGRKILKDLKLVAVPESVRTDYLLLVDQRVKALDAGNGKVTEIRQLFSSITDTINDCVDDRFWDIWVRRFFATIYAVMLLGVGVILLVIGYDCFCLDIFNIVLVGAAGGLTSGIISTEPEYMSKGHFWLPTCYYSIVRPTVGAISAVAIFWMVQSNYLIRVEPPLLKNCEQGYNLSAPADCNTASTKTASTKTAQTQAAPTQAATTKTASTKTAPTQAAAPIAGAPGASKAAAPPFANISATAVDNGESSLVTLRAAKGKQMFLYLLLLFFAGFSGDKLLKSISCKMMTRLFIQAEKSKDGR